MDGRLVVLQKLALADEKLKSRFLSARTGKDPLTEFCKIAKELGIEITPEELSTLGEESCAAMLRSQNGGGEYEPCGGWDDEYELFFLPLEK